MKRSLLFILAAFVSLSGCGGEIGFNADNADPTSLEGTNPGAGTTDLSVREYYDENIFPLMNGSTAGKTCAGSGCHDASNSPVSSEDTFFKVDPDSADVSFQWASVRRTNTVDTSTDFADSSSKSLPSRVTDSHLETFGGWDSDDTNLIQTWATIVE